MKIKWLGHASFLITSAQGTRIITDPYLNRGNLQYGEIKETADVVTVSHDHFDHNNVAAVKGNPQVYKMPSPTEIKGVKFYGVATEHDENGGRDRGHNMITVMDVDGVKVCHLGDLGHKLSPEQVAQIGKVDVLLAPVGGLYTINADVAASVSQDLKPKVIIPMHFKNQGCAFPIAPVDDFLKGKSNVTRYDTAEVELEAGKLPGEARIIVLQPAL